MRYDRYRQFKAIGGIVASFLVAYGLLYLGAFIKWRGVAILGFCFLVISFLIAWMVGCRVYDRYEMNQGLRHAYRLWRLEDAIKTHLYRAGYYEEVLYGDRIFRKVPEVSAYLDDSEQCQKGIVRIQNSVKLHKKLDEVVLVSALPGDYIVARSWLSDDGNMFCFEVEKGELTRHVFDRFEAYAQHVMTGPYELYIDDRHHLTLSHALIVGQTGSGKSYFLYNLVLQILLKDDWQLHIADPKCSGLFALGNAIDPAKAASDMDDIISMIERIKLEMDHRMTEFYDLVSSKLDSSYMDFGLPAIILIIDEYSVFQAALNQYDKTTRDKINTILGNIVRAGRQIGVFLIAAQQQTNAKNLPTEFKENMPLKIVLGNAERETYITALGAMPEQASRRFEPGQGLMVYPGIASVDNPVIISTDTLKFDVYEAARNMKS